LSKGKGLRPILFFNSWVNHIFPNSEYRLKRHLGNVDWGRVDLLKTNQKRIICYKGLFRNWTKRLVVCSLFACVAALLQAMGGFTGPGYVLSPFATLPIMLASILTFREGFITYLVTIGILTIIQPTELFVFPFTTGIIGLGIGTAISYLESGIVITLIGGISLSTGILTLLFVIGFPVLGPGILTVFNLQIAVYVFIFSLLYSWVWLKIGLITITTIYRISKHIR
jgi:hypothetical protein